MWHEWSTLKKLIWLHILQGASAIIKTVTGTSPLVLDNAVNKAIKRLVQYGKCATVDGDIYCNNGKLVAVDDELPSGYKRLLDVTTNGNLRYVSNVHITGADTLRFTYKSSPGNLVGSYHDADADDNYSYYPTASATAKYARYNGQTGGSSSATGTEYTIEMSPTGIEGTRNPSSFTPSTFTASIPFCIFATSPTGTPMSSATIYGSIEISGSQSVKFIPCERESDGAIGYYETLNGEFLVPQGDGEATTSGYDTTHLVPRVVGTPEVLTVSGKNLLDPATSNIVIGEYYLGNGTSSNSVNNWRTGLIPVIGGKTYAFWGRSKADNTISAFNRINWFTENGTNISPRPSYTQDTVTVATAPSNAVFAGLSCSPYNSSATITKETFDQFNWMFVEAAQEIPYQPYTAQTATVPDLFAVGDVKDEVEIISGAVTRRTEVSVANGVITISALAEPVTEQTTPQPLSTVEGTNTVSWTAEVSGTVKEIEYAQAAPATVPFVPKNSTGLLTADGKTFRVKEE